VSGYHTGPEDRDPLLELKQDWMRYHGPDPRFLQLDLGSDQGHALGWGGLWHVYWRTPAQARLVLDALAWYPVERILAGPTSMASGVPGLKPVADRFRWTAYFREAGIEVLNPAEGRVDKCFTAGYVITSRDLPVAARALHGDPVAGLLDGTGCWHVLRHNGADLGWILSAFRSPQACLLEALEVLPDYRGTGCATRLVSIAGAGRTCWLLAAASTATDRFWRGQGFRPMGEYGLFEGPGHSPPDSQLHVHA
jgi:GNAT superfamily N-acetyltransferase